LALYLRQEQPDALLSAKTRCNLVAIWAKRLAKVETRIIVSERTNLSMMIRQSPKWRWRFIVPLLQHIYPQANLMTAVSNGVADDFSSCTGLPREGINTIYNPLLTHHIKTQSVLPAIHSWFDTEKIPVILGISRLAPSKDFPTLLRAFAHIHRKQPARLLILGEGKERARLEDLASELDITEHVSFP